MDEVEVDGVLEADADGPWRFVRIPPEVRTAFRDAARRGGTIPVAVRAGGLEWTSSLLPWADGAAQLNIPKQVQQKLGLAPGDRITVRLRADPRA